MTKPMEEALAAAARLPVEDQEVLAAQIMADIRALDEAGPVPEWHKEILRRRKAEREANPDRLLTLDQFRAAIEQQKAARC